MQSLKVSACEGHSWSMGNIFKHSLCGRGCPGKDTLLSWEAGVHSFVLRIVQAVTSNCQHHANGSWFLECWRVFMWCKSLESWVLVLILSSRAWTNHLSFLNSKENSKPIGNNFYDDYKRIKNTAYKKCFYMNIWHHY